MSCLVVMYHYVRDTEATPFPAIRALPPALFEAQLDWLGRDRRVIALDELTDAIEGHAPWPSDSTLLTFDDGFGDHYHAVLPALARRGWRGVFFLAHEACGASPRVLGVHKTHFLLARLGADAFARAVLAECESGRAAVDGAAGVRVFGADHWELADERAIKHLLNYELPFDEADRVLDTLFARHIGAQESFARELYLRESMVAEMARAGMTFGYHTRSHRMLSRLSVAEQEAELRDGVAWIQALTGQVRVPFCYPWGGVRTYTTDTVDLLARTGYSVAFNTARRRMEFGRDGRFELPRVDTRDLPPYQAAERASTPESASEGA
jgi:peptidoglycan/xylan/chitin deacetylase (PgdA/CDA1 family)